MFSFLNSFIKRKKAKREMEKKGLIGSRKRQKQEETLAHVADKSKPVGFIILLIVWCTAIMVLTLHKSQRSFSRLVPTMDAPYTLSSEFNFSYEDKEKTELERVKAKAKVPLIYKIDIESCDNSINRAEELFNEVLKRVDDEKKGQTFVVNKDDSISNVVGNLSKEAINVLLLIIQNPKLKELYMNQLKIQLTEGVIDQSLKDNHIYGQKIRIEDTKGRRRQPHLLAEIKTPIEAANTIADAISKKYSPNNREVLKQAISDITAIIIHGNLVYDEKTTDEIKNKEAELVPPSIIEVQRGDIILRKGREVEKKDIIKHDAYINELKKRDAQKKFWKNLINNGIICLILMFITGIYISHIHPEVVRSNQMMWLIGTVTIVSMLLIFGSIELFNTLSSDQDIAASHIFMILPLGIAAMLISVLVGLRVAFYVGVFVSIIAALQLGDAYRLIIDGIAVSGLVGIAVRYSRNYKSYYLKGAFAVFVTVVLVNYNQFWTVTENANIVTWIFGLALLNGIITATCSLILLFVFETLFQVSTNMSLLTLCDYNHPLLKRLQLEAPGSYHHSLMVATLAEQAAEEIGANPIKARVCALFHDIGKLSQPEYFIENSYGTKNKHNELHPRMSSLIILNHVKEGIDMAITFKLRRIIRDAIQQHHGTDLVFYFYKRALEENRGKDNPVDEQEYRYAGPLPRDKEVVLVSLADACEAASRTLQKPSPHKVTALVWEIFRKRIRDGQLDKADLTFGELAKVRDSFSKTISTMLHGRIAYPKEEEEDEDDLFKAAKEIPNTDQDETLKVPKPVE